MEQTDFTGSKILETITLPSLRTSYKTVGERESTSNPCEVNPENFTLLLYLFEYRLGFLLPEAGLCHFWHNLQPFPPSTSSLWLVHMSAFYKPPSGDHFPKGQEDAIHSSLLTPHPHMGFAEGPQWKPLSFSVTSSNACLLALNTLKLSQKCLDDSWRH